MIRESQYNYEVSGLEDGSYICNGLSGTIIRKPTVPLTSSKIADQDRAFLLTHHFLVEDSVDELQLLMQRNMSMPEMLDRLELTIMLHEDCNFRCTYCFQDFVKRKLTGEVLDDLLHFIDERLPEGGTLFNHFYGGEPLLAWDSLVHINSSISSIVERKKGAYRFFITTNGSLLTSDKCEYLAEHKVAHVKITLDGPADVHDLRRVKVNGRGTFDRILENLCTAVSFFKVILRVNLDSANIGHVHRLLDTIAYRSSHHRNLYLDYNIVYDRLTGELTPGVTYDDLYELQSAALDLGFKLNLPPLTRPRYCKFNSKNSYLVDTEGSLFLCSKSPSMYVGNVKRGIDFAAPHVSDSSLPVINSASVLSAFHNPKEHCLTCNLLPICGGGCTLLSYNTENPPCPPWKEQYTKYLNIHCRNMDASVSTQEVIYEQS